MRRLAALALLLLLALLARGAVAGPEDTAPGCRHWAVMLPEDAGQLRIYDGIRKGLEVAQLERLCLKDLADTEEAFKAFVAEHAALPEPRPLVFLIGRRAGDRMLAAGFQGPGVYVSAEWTVEGAPLRPEPVLPPGVVRVRSELPGETLYQALLGAHGPCCNSGLHLLRIPVPPEESAAAELLRRLLQGTPIDVTTGTYAGACRLELALRSGLGVSSVPRPRQGLYVSDDVGDYGAGAALVLCPDHERVGRTAAEAGRRLWRREPSDAALVVRGVQILVDLDVWDEQGTAFPVPAGRCPPLTFLAGVDGIKGRRAPASAPGAAR